MTSPEVAAVRWLATIRPQLARFLRTTPAPGALSVLVAIDRAVALTYRPGLLSQAPPGAAAVLVWLPPPRRRGPGARGPALPDPRAPRRHRREAAGPAPYEERRLLAWRPGEVAMLRFATSHAPLTC